MNVEEMDMRFDQHALNDEQKLHSDSIRHVAKGFAVCINDLCPEGREKSLALTRLEECLFFANASIARS